MSRAEATKPDRFAKVSDGMLADAYGTAVAVEKAAETEKDALRGEFIRRKLWSAEGDLFVVTKSNTPTERLDTTKIRVEMGEDWCKCRSKTAIATSLRASRKVASESEPPASKKANAPKRAIEPKRAPAQATTPEVSLLN